MGTDDPGQDRMDAIKKKMQAMKIEKDNAMDRADTLEQNCKEAKRRANKTEEEHGELLKKATQIEAELKKVSENLINTSQIVEGKEKALLAAELEVTNLNRKVQGLDGDLERSEDKLVLATQKLDKAATAADDNGRMRKVLDARAQQDEEKLGKLEDELKASRTGAEDADKKYEEIAKKLVQVEGDLEKAEERAEMAEMKILELEEELRVVANNLKSL